MIITTQQEYERLIEKYPLMKLPIEKELEYKLQYYNKQTKKQLEKKQKWEKQFYEFLNCVKEQVLFINEDFEKIEKKLKKKKKERRETKKEEPKQKNPFNKLHYATLHLPFFHEFSSLIGLYGRHYLPLLKSRWYQLHGGVLQKKIKFGGLATDTRLHIAYPIVTEGGKNELIYAIKSLIENGIEKQDGETFTISEPISYSPESLIGKYVEKLIDNPDISKKRKIRTRIENRGHFDNDFLEFDECTKLITSNSPEDNQAREYLSKAENPIGKNKVEKRLVDDTKDEKVSYCPNCTNSYYFQPYLQIPESAILQGFLRRKIIPVGDIQLFLNVADENLYSQKIEEINFSEAEYRDKIINHLELMRARLKKADFIFTEESKQLIRDYALYLSEQGRLHSEKIENYCKISKYTILSHLVKMSCIVSASYYTNQVDKNSVSLAFMDLVELMQNTYDFIYQKVQGNLDYGTTWKSADYKQVECLKYLYENKAFSFESSEVSIREFLEEAVMPIYKIKESQARNRYLDMKKKGLVSSTQDEQHGSKIWLTFNPTLQKTYLEGNKGFKGYTAYNMVFEGLNGIVRVLQSLQPLKPCE